jgi:hypothetical protein
LYNVVIIYTVLTDLLRMLSRAWLRRLVAGLSSQRSGFTLGSVDVGYVLDKVTLEQGFLRVPRFYPVSIIPAGLHTHIAYHLGVEQ